MTDDRSINNPLFNINESNEILRRLSALENIYSHRLHLDRYGLSINLEEQEDKPITLKDSFSNILAPYSIFLVSQITTDPPDFSVQKPCAQTQGQLGDPLTPETEEDRYRYVFATNGEQHRPGSSHESFADCEIIGTDKPHRLRYHGPNGRTAEVNDRMGFDNDRYTLKFDATGPFTCVSKGSSLTDEIGHVWAIIHNHQLSYIPWVITTVIPPGHPLYNSVTGVYPDINSNTFVVRRVRAYYDNSTPGYQNIDIIPGDEYYIAINPCGYLPEGTVRRITLDRGEWYLTQDCILPPSSSSRSSSSPSSSSPSSPSSSSPSSSSPCSSSSSSPSSSSPSPSSSLSSPSSSSIPSSSESSSPSSLSSSSSTPVGEPCGCNFIYTGSAWILNLDNCSADPEVCEPPCANMPIFPGTPGEIRPGFCPGVLG